MEVYIYLLVALGAVLALLVAVFFVLLFNRESHSTPIGSVHGSGGVDVDRGQMNGEEIHGYRGIVDPLTRVNRGVRASVYLEESQTMNQFRADLGGPLVIGRLVTGTPSVNHLSVSMSSYLSRQHARLSEERGTVYLANLSKFGTKINGSEIRQPTAIFAGDLIEMGDVQLRVLGIDFYHG